MTGYQDLLIMCFCTQAVYVAIGISLTETDPQGDPGVQRSAAVALSG